ncbi:MAG TPA: hypothetical protein VFP84_31170, partial [Kofleriaceae bacterium]|nr:hypothetical protein [Kofleriaceae bacterium]
VAAAAGVAPPRPATSAPITPAGEPVLPPPAGDPGMRSTGEHNVIDDGNKTVIMQAIDPADVEATLDTGAEPQTSDTSEPSEASEASEPSDDGDDEQAEPPPTEASAPAKASVKKRKRRR